MGTVLSLLSCVVTSRASAEDGTAGRGAEHGGDRDARGERADLPARLADDDTADGRVDGDLALVLGLGLSVAEHPRGAVDLRVRYVDTVGVFATYEESFGAAAADPVRVMASGLELRPLFLGRWATGSELGVRWADLIIDSLGLELGAFIEQPLGAPIASRPGMEAGVGIGVPLFGSASGPWLDVHAIARWSSSVLAGESVGGEDDRALVLSITLAYHRFFATHTVDVRDAAP